MSYSVRYAKSIYASQVENLPASARAEVDAHVTSLKEHPIPGDGGAVFRVRMRTGSPLYAARTRRFMVYHTIEDDCVVIVSVLPIPRLKP